MFFLYFLFNFLIILTGVFTFSSSKQGINVQHCYGKGTEAEITTRILAVIKLNSRYTAKNIPEKINSVFKIFSLSTKNLFAITSDNASNMIKTTGILSEISL